MNWIPDWLLIIVINIKEATEISDIQKTQGVLSEKFWSTWALMSSVFWSWQFLKNFFEMRLLRVQPITLWSIWHNVTFSLRWSIYPTASHHRRQQKDWIACVFYCPHYQKKLVISTVSLNVNIQSPLVNSFRILVAMRQYFLFVVLLASFQYSRTCQLLYIF